MEVILASIGSIWPIFKHDPWGIASRVTCLPKCDQRSFAELYQKKSPKEYMDYFWPEPGMTYPQFSTKLWWTKVSYPSNLSWEVLYGLRKWFSQLSLLSWTSSRGYHLSRFVWKYEDFFPIFCFGLSKRWQDLPAGRPRSMSPKQKLPLCPDWTWRSGRWTLCLWYKKSSLELVQASPRWPFFPFVRTGSHYDYI